jgi:hypothetical protein
MTDLPALREAVAKMTGGPWFAYYSQDKQAWTVQNAPGWLFVASDKGTDADAAGIVALRNAAPALLDEVERLRQERDALQETSTTFDTLLDKAADLFLATPEAKNYLSLGLVNKLGHTFEVTIQNTVGETPSQQNQKLRAELAAARGELSAVTEQANGLFAECNAQRADLAPALAVLEQAFRDGYEAGAGDYGQNYVDAAWLAWRERQR